MTTYFTRALPVDSSLREVYNKAWRSRPIYSAPREPEPLAFLSQGIGGWMEQSLRPESMDDDAARAHIRVVACRRSMVSTGGRAALFPREAFAGAPPIVNRLKPAF